MKVKETTETDIDDLNLEARAYFDKPDFKKSTELAEKAHKLATKLKYPKGIAEALLTRGILFWVQQENLKAREVFIQAYKIIVTLDNKALLNNVYSKLGITYGQLYLSEECTYYLTEALDVSLSMKDDKLIAEDYANLAIALNKFKNYTKAIEYYNKAMILTQKLSDDKLQASILTNLLSLYRYKGDFELALKHGFDALAICEKHNNTRMIITIYYNISACYISLKRFDDAEKYANLCLTLANDNNVTPWITRAELLRAEINLLQKNYEEAINILTRVETLPAFKGDVESIYNYYNLFLKVYEATADYKRAYKKHIDLMDFDRNQAEANLKAKLEIQELKLTLQMKGGKYRSHH